MTLEKNGLTEDDVLMAVLEAGAEDVNDLGDSFEVITEPSDLVAVRTALQDAGIDYESAEASFQPSVSVPVDIDGARKVFKLVDALEDSDDVQNVWTNVDVSDEVLAALDARGHADRVSYRRYLFFFFFSRCGRRWGVQPRPAAPRPRPRTRMAPRPVDSAPSPPRPGSSSVS